MRSFVAALFVALAIGACTTVPGDGPAPAAAVTAVQAPAAYLAPDAIDMTQLLPPPPAAGSAAERAELDKMLAIQKSRTPARLAQAQADAHVSLAAFGDVLGPALKPEALPLTNAFFQKVGRASGPYVGLTKDCWVRIRPFVTEPRLAPPDDVKASTAVRGTLQRAQVPLGPNSPCAEKAPPSDYSYSYPSGHASWGAMTAILLAQMVPEKRAELFARGWDYGESRIIGGVHYPSDVEAGRIEAEVLVALMMETPQFQTDMAAARAELRAALGLTP